jgi:hypothetical protein
MNTLAYFAAALVTIKESFKTLIIIKLFFYLSLILRQNKQVALATKNESFNTLKFIKLFLFSTYSAAK